jgi:hypothetical protein
VGFAPEMPAIRPAIGNNLKFQTGDFAINFA